MKDRRSRSRRVPRAGWYTPSGWLRTPVTRRGLVLGAASLLLGACSRQVADSDQQSSSTHTPTPQQDSTSNSEPSPTPSFAATSEPDPTNVPADTPEPVPTEPPVPDPTPPPGPPLTAVAEPEPEGTLFENLVHRDEWSPAVRTPQWEIIGRVTTELLYIRSEPRLDGPIIDMAFARHVIIISDVVEGEPVEGDYRWFRVGQGRFVTAAFVEPFIAPEIEQSYEGRWIDVNLTSFYAIAYDGWNPRYAAIITAGRGERTPKGVFEVLYRVRNETMDSETVEIPPGDPEYYYLENVEFTQYFAEGGYAIHGNYWTEPQNFGAFSSNGCVGLMNRDAEWFWNFLDVGSTVSIHF